MFEHHAKRAIVKVGIAGQHGIREVRQGMQKWMIDSVNHLHNEERIFADQVVIFQVDDDILACSVMDHFTETFRRALHIRRGILKLQSFGGSPPACF